MTPERETARPAGATGPAAHDAGLVDAESPWPGLASFREADRAFFRGREEEAEALARLVLRERLTVLFGLSGLGKTSLLAAGVFPRLREEGILPVSLRLVWAPGAPDPVTQVQEAIARQAEAAGVEAPAVRSGETLWEHFHRAGNEFWNERNRLVVPLLVFDQFEEVFTLGRGAPAAEGFLVELADLVEGRAPAAVKARLDAAPAEAKEFTFGRHGYKVLLSLREDFLPDLEGLRRRMPAIANNRLRLERMNGRQALAVVAGAGAHLISEGVARQVVRFVARAEEGSNGDADEGGEEAGAGVSLERLEVEPALLSVVCRELNSKRRQRGEPRITAELLAGSRAAILADLYERSLADLDPAVRAFVEDRLLTVSGYRDSVALENALEAPGVTREALDRLVDRRLVRVEERGGVERVELTHDLLTGVIRESRDRRHQREATARAEVARQEAEAREAVARRELRRSRRITALVGLLALAAVAGAALGFVEHRKARAAQLVAQEALSRSDLERARDLVVTDRAAQALAHLARSLEIDADNLPARGSALSLLVHRGWPALTALLSHGQPVLAVDWSADGRLVATASADGTARLWDARSGETVGEPARHDGPVAAVRFAPGGELFATASADGTARLWSAADGRPRGEPLPLAGPGRAVAFDRAGGVLLAVGGPEARLFEVATGRTVGAPLRHEEPVTSADWSPDGRLVVTASEDWTARIWEARTGRAVGAPLAHEQPVAGAWFDPEGRRVVTASDDNTARIWDAATGRPLGDPLPHESSVAAAAWSPDGSRVATGSDDNAARLWDVATGRPVGEPLRHASAVVLVRFSADGGRLLTASRDGSARLWEIATGEAVGEPMRHAGAVLAAALSPDGRRVATASRDGSARLWVPWARGARGLRLRQGAAGVLDAAWSPDGRRVLTVTHDGTARVWDAERGETVWSPAAEAGWITAATWSADGRSVVTAAWDGTARRWDAATGGPRGEPLRHGSQPLAAARASADGRFLATGGRDGTARLWDAATGRPVGEPLRHRGALRRLAFSPDGGLLATTSDDGAARLWATATGAPAGKAVVHRGPVLDVAFSPDGRRLATASADGTARLWDVATGTALGPPLTHRDAVLAVRFSPDGRLVATASASGMARIWDAATGEQLGASLDHMAEVTTLDFSPDGRLLATGSEDNAARLWEARTGLAIGGPMRHGGSVTAVRFSPDGGRLLTAAEDGLALIRDVPVGEGRDGAALAALAEAVSGYEVRDHGAALPVADPLARLAALRDHTERGDVSPVTAALIRWYLADPESRPESPLGP